MENSLGLGTFSSLDDFIAEQNNFYLHFCDPAYEKAEYFVRFRDDHSDIVSELQGLLSPCIGEDNLLDCIGREGYRKMWRAYNKMISYVFREDEQVVDKDGSINKWVLID